MDGRENLRLCKIELKNFYENLKDFFEISSKFQRILDDMEEEDSFQCPIQAPTEGSVAWGIVESSAVTAKNYRKVIERVKNRFGDEEFLIEYCVRELLGL
jgi:hypothetical protein